MSHSRFVVAPIVAAKAREAGPAGERWLRELPDTIAFLEAAWDVRTQEQVEGGTASFVAKAVTATEHGVVLKIAIPEVGFEQEVWTLAAAQGRGYVRMLAHDLSRNAVLLEALGPSLDRSDLSPIAQLSVLGALLKQAWQVPRNIATPVTDKAASLATMLEDFAEQLTGAVSDHTVEYALACARRRSAALDENHCVWLHGDPSPVNTLRVLQSRPGAPTGFVFVDAASFTGDPAYDAGVALRDWCPQLLAAPDPHALLRSYTQELASISGTDPVAVWEWSYLERVSTGLYCLSLGDEVRARPFLTTASALVHSPQSGFGSFVATRIPIEKRSP